MKKNMFKSVALMAVVTFWGIVLTSCGGNSASGSSAVKEAISAAESEIALTETPVFGNLPSLFEQKLEAGTILGKHFRELKTEDMDKAVKNKQLRDEAEKELAAYYNEKIGTAAEALDGKNIKVEFDKSQFTDATVTLKVTEKEMGYFNFVFDATPVKPINKEVEFKWIYMDAEGNELQVSSDYITPGEKIQKEYVVLSNKDYCKKFDHLYIKY